MFSHVNATLSGLSTIRSTGKEVEGKLVDEFDHYQDEHSGAWYLTITTGTALAIFIDSITASLIAVITFSSIFFLSGKLSTFCPVFCLHSTDFCGSGENFGGNIGLALSQAAILSGMVQYGMRLFTEFMSQMTCVSRVLEYTNLPKEYPLVSETPPPKNWPNQGRIKLEEVSMSYDTNGPKVLKVI